MSARLCASGSREKLILVPATKAGRITHYGDSALITLLLGDRHREFIEPIVKCTVTVIFDDDRVGEGNGKRGIGPAAP
jgi:hypothetical protein